MVISIDEVEESIALVQSALIDFDHLHHLQQILEWSKGKLIIGSSLKSIRKQCLKIAREIGNAEKKYDDRASKVLQNLRTLWEYFPPLRPNLEGAARILKVQSIYLSNYTSKRQGTLRSLLKEPIFDREKVLELAAHIREIVTEIVRVLQQLNDYIEKNKSALQRHIFVKDHLVLDLDAICQRRGYELHQPLIIIDASFAKELALEKRRERKRSVAITASGDIVIPQRVYDEMHHHLAGIGPTLVPRTITNYLLQSLHARIVTVVPLPAEVDEIIRLWKSTSKGGHASNQEEELFRHSGDMDILVLTRRIQNRPILILSNDNDISGVVHYFQRPYRYKVRVIEYQEGRVSFAA